jgi:hypothetical protein
LKHLRKRHGSARRKQRNEVPFPGFLRQGFCSLPALTHHFVRVPLQVALVLVLGTIVWTVSPAAMRGQTSVPTARLIPASTIAIPVLTDSNSPVVWERVAGQLRLFVFASESGVTTRLEGADISRIASRGLVRLDGHPGHGVWIESIVPDVDGTWYGYYHNEWPAEVCDDATRTIPRIGAARSHDFGITWQDLGTILEAPRTSYDCASTNQYFVGGVGDFSVMLDRERQYLYFFVSQYANRETVQGVAAARMVWADRDMPQGKLSLWLRNQTWLPIRTIATPNGDRYLYPAGGPIYRAAESWHDSDAADAFWGPSVHWNTYVQQYVMLLNRAQDSAWTQEGVYIAFTPHLDDPGTWSIPERLIGAGAWYPQVVGLESGTGTDREAGERARFFLGGKSHYIIQFSR